MFDDLECECVYVEMSNDKVPGSGRIEYCADVCDICHARIAILRADGKMGLAFDTHASRHLRLH